MSDYWMLITQRGNLDHDLQGSGNTAGVDNKPTPHMKERRKGKEKQSLILPAACNKRERARSLDITLGPPQRVA